MASKRIRHWTSLILVFTFVIGLTFPVAATSAKAAAGLTDISDHWAKDKITQWVQKGLVSGYTDGTFKPDKSITRAEFVTLVNKVLGFSEKAIIEFSDVTPTDWFYEEIAKAVKAGYISGYQDGTVKPNREISRQEAAVALCKALNLEIQGDVTEFTDKDAIPNWSRPYIGTLAAKGYMGGYPDGSFKAERHITRAETVTMLDKVLGTLQISYDVSGVYGPEEGIETISQDVAVNVPGVTLRNMIIEGNLYLNEGIGEGDATLDNVTVKGITTVRGGGKDSIHLVNFTGEEIIVIKVGGKVRIVASGNTKVGELKLESGAHIEGNGIASVTVLKSGEDVILDGAFENVIIEAKAKIEVLKGTIINNLKVNSKSDINLADGATVKDLILEAAAAITGKGTIEKAKINADGAKLETEPKKVELAKGVAVEIAGKEVKEDKTSSKSGGGGGGGGTDKPTIIKVQSVSLDKSSVTLAVYESVYYQNSVTLTATIEPDNATNKKVTWKSSNNGVATVTGKGLNATVNAVNKGQATITVTTDDGGKTAECNVTVVKSETSVIPVSAISVEGEAVVGQTLTAKVTPPEATVTYQWQRADAADGTFENISDATNSTYTLTNEDAGKYIRVTATGTGKYRGTAESTAVGPVKWPVYNEGKETGYTAIQEAIDTADAGDTIVIAAGTFTEPLTISKSLTILGVNDDKDPRTEGLWTDESVVAGGIRITSGDVTLKGLTIKDKGIFALSSTGSLTVVNNRIESISNAHQGAEDGSIIALDINPATGPIVIQQNVFSDIGQENSTGTAIRIIGVADSITIADNIIKDVTKNGINLYRNCLAKENAILTITGNEINNWDSDKDNNNIGGRAIRIDFAGAHTTATADITENKLIPPVYGSDEKPVDPEYVKLTAVDIKVYLFKNYWGSPKPNFETILLVAGDKASECAYVPYYTNEAMTTLVEPEVTFTFTGLDNIVAGTVGFAINTKVTNNGAIADNIPLRYKAVVTKDGSALANQVIKYPEAGDNLDPSTWHSFTTDAEGVAYFGPSSGFTLTQLPALLSAEGVTTPFQADFAAGSYSVTVSLLDISGGEVVLGSGTKEFTVIAPETINFKTPAEQFLTGYTRPSVLYDGTNYHLWYRTYGTTPMKAYHRVAATISGLKNVTGNELKLGENIWEGLDNFSIIKDAGKYYMFNSNSGGNEINVYESADGFTWGNTSTKVLDTSAVGDWAKKKIDNPMVVYDGTEYKLYYQGKSDTNGYQIGLATSDSLTGLYTPVSEPVLKPGTDEEWDAGQLYQPWVVKDGDFYYMWYAAGSGPKAIGYAWSTDGIKWTKTDGSVITSQDLWQGKPSVVKVGNDWHMWFLHEKDYNNADIMYVSSNTQ